MESLQVLGDLADVAWFQVNRDREVVALSSAMEDLTGISREKAIGRPCIYLSRCHECLQACGVFQQGHVEGHELTLYSEDGSEIPVSKSGQVILDEQGEIVGALEVVRPLDRPRIGEPCGAPPAEVDEIQQALRETKYNRTLAANRLGMSRTTLWRKMREYGL